MSLKINNDTITYQDLIGGNSDAKYFNSNLTQLVPNKTGYKLFGSPLQRQQLKQFVNDSFVHNINYTPKFSNIVNPGDNTSFYTKTSQTHTIYSSFSTTKFIKLSHPFMPENNTWSITTRIKTPSSFDAANQFLGSDGSYYRTIGGEFGTNQHFGCGITSNGSSWDIGWIWGTTTLIANTWYYYKLSFTGTQYKLEIRKEDDKDYTLEGVINSSTPIYQTNNSIICFGHQGSGYLRGEFDLTATKIIIDNVVWFDGSINSYDCEINGTSLYKKVNNGQITYSNFSTSNYLKTINNFAPENNNWSIEVPIITGSDISTGQNVISEHTNYSFTIGEVSGHINYYLSSNGTSWTTSNDPGSFTINSNTAYTWKSEYNAQNNLFTCYVKEGNNSYVEDYSNSIGIHAPTNYLKFGVSRTSIAPWLGQIVLSGVKIKIGNDIWFNGETANVKEFSLQGSPTISQEEVDYYTYHPFTLSFDINDAAFTQGTKYLLEDPNLVKIKTENNNLYFNFPWKDNKWYYLPNNILQEGVNVISLSACKADIPYLAYTPSGGTQENSYYTKIRSASSGDTLYNNEFTALDPQPNYIVQDTGLINADVVGSLTDNNGVYDGFNSNTDYILTTFSLPDNTTNWSFETKITTSSDINSNSIFVCTTQQAAAGIACSFALNIVQGKFRVYLSSNGTSWNIASGLDSAYNVLTNTTYYIKFTYTNGVYTFYYSLDGITYTSDSNLIINDTKTLKGFTAIFGTWYPTDYFRGSIDLNKTKFIVNGVETSFYNNSAQKIIITSETPNIVCERTPENDIMQQADYSDQIKLNVNNHNFTLVASGEDMPTITTGVLGYKEDLIF